jgi:hypothetical protein
MKFITDIITYIRKVVSHYFLNMLLLLVNVLVGFYTQYNSIMFSALAAITISTYLYDADNAKINMEFMDLAVILSILVPMAFLWFERGHPDRVYAGLILLWALSFVILDKLYTSPDQPYMHPAGLLLTPLQTLTHPVDDMKVIIRYLGAYGHFIFNAEWALLVLL